MSYKVNYERLEKNKLKRRELRNNKLKIIILGTGNEFEKNN